MSIFKGVLSKLKNKASPQALKCIPNNHRMRIKVCLKMSFTTKNSHLMD